MGASDFIDALPVDPRIITAYDDTGFRIKKVRYEGALVIFGDTIIPWKIATSAQITKDSLKMFWEASNQPEFILIGAGSKPHQPSMDIRACLKEHKIGLEYMTTRSALSTWPILLADGRHVAGCFLPAGAV